MKEPDLLKLGLEHLKQIGGLYIKHSQELEKLKNEQTEQLFHALSDRGLSSEELQALKNYSKTEEPF